MITDERFDAIVTGFYRAAAGDVDWLDALTAFQQGLPASAVHMHAIDLAQGCISFSYSASLLPAEAELDYIRAYHRIDPRADKVIGLAPGEWMHCWQHFDEAFVASDPFYQEFLIPYGGRYVSGVKLLQRDSLCVVLGVHRGRNSARLDVAELEVCDRLARHLSQALLLHDAAVTQHHQGRLGAELLTRMRVPVMLIDEQRRVHHANPAARRLLCESGAVAESAGRLYCRRPVDDNALLLGLRRLFRDDGAQPAAASCDKVFVRVAATSTRATLGLYLYALRPAETLYAFGRAPLAMLLLHAPEARLELDPFVLAATFELTPAEARVAMATAHGDSVEQIARGHAVSVHTVRSQLRVVFQKTGATRQAELVSLLACLPVGGLGLGIA